MNISLENWLRNKLQENEEMHDYAVATERVRCWIDEYKQLSQPAVIKSVCEKCRFKAECRYKEMNTEQNCKYFIDEQTVL